MANADFSLLGTVITVKSFPPRFAAMEGIPPHFEQQPGRYFVHEISVDWLSRVRLGVCAEPPVGVVVTAEYLDDHHVDFFDVKDLDIER